MATGQSILGKEHHLTQMVSRVTECRPDSCCRPLFCNVVHHCFQVMERMEELRSMLGWILVHWRVQKQQWLHRKKRREPVQDNIYTEAAMCSPLTEVNKHRCMYCRHECGFKAVAEMFVSLFSLIQQHLYVSALNCNYGITNIFSFK